MSRKRWKILKSKLKTSSEDNRPVETHIMYKLAQAELNKVDAGWREFELQAAENIIEDGHSCHGLTDFNKAFIRLDITMDHDTALETIIHELTHVVLETVGLGGGDEDKEISIKNEDATTLISRGFLQMMRLNPDLFDIIQESIAELNDIPEPKPKARSTSKSS